MAITPTAKPFTPANTTPKPASTWVWKKGPFCIGDPGSHYNGHSWDERVATNPIQKQALREHKITKPTVCGITGSSDGYVYMHNEDYGLPLEFYAVHRFAHSILHERFTNPLAWNKLVKRHYKHGAWFTFLTMDPADMLRPYAEVYPEGLPHDGDFWPDVADRLGLSAGSFVHTKEEAACNGLHTGNVFRDGLPGRLRIRRRHRS